jgi:hypothetical protein
MISQLTATVTIAGGLVAITVAVCSGLRWIFRRGEDSGRAQVEHDAEQWAQAQAATRSRDMAERVAELESELEYLRRHRRGA